MTGRENRSHPGMRKATAIALLLFLFSLGLNARADLAQDLIRYPSAGKDFEKHHAYPLALLRLALSKTSPNTRLKASKAFMQQGRALKQLEHNRDVDVVWTMTSAEREAALIPIRIPIYKGLIGWRVCLMPEQNTAEPAKNTRDLKTLKKMVMIQGHDWPDTDILKANGFHIDASPSYSGLFQMLEYGRADLFPRSIIEVWSELEKFKGRGIRLEENILIRYPTASYFFVSKHNIDLARIVESGLREAMQDGSFDALFHTHFHHLIQRAKLDTRTHFELKNPLLPADTPLTDEALWFRY